MTEQAEKVRRWLEDHFSGPVVSLHRQARWRPVWFATVETQNVRRDVVVRGDRTDMELIFPLDHEMRFQKIMFDHGLPVPEVHGWLDDPTAWVMDTVEGEPYLLDASEEQRRTVMGEYMTALAELHALPLAPFVEHDIVRAVTPEESGQVGLARYVTRYRRAKRFPDPFLEFGLAWLERNPPNSHGREAPIVWDSGQFHHRDGHLQAILDVELGHIGDPMMDLAAFRMRDTIGGFGPFAELYEMYERAAGTAIDLDAIKTHHFAFTLSNRLAFSSQLREPNPDSDLMTNLQWCRETDLFATEALAEILHIDLPEIELPAEVAESRARPAHQQVIDILRSVSIDDEYQRYELRKAFRLARHIQRTDEIGAIFDAADLDEMQPLLGYRPASWQEGESALEDFVLHDGGAHDRELVALFHTRHLRAQALLGPEGSAMTQHHRIQGFDA